MQVTSLAMKGLGEVGTKKISKASLASRGGGTMQERGPVELETATVLKKISMRDSKPF